MRKKVWISLGIALAASFFMLFQQNGFAVPFGDNILVAPISIPMANCSDEEDMITYK